MNIVILDTMCVGDLLDAHDFLHDQHDAHPEPPAHRVGL